MGKAMQLVVVNVLSETRNPFVVEAFVETDDGSVRAFKDSQNAQN